MMCRAVMTLALLGAALEGAPLRAMSLQLLTSARQWALLEYRLTGVPAVSNTFDPDVISLDATFLLPSGKRMVVPAFSYRPYLRALQDGREVLTPQAGAEWRLRFTPPEAGDYALSLELKRGGVAQGAPLATNLVVAPDPDPGHRRGFVRVAPNNLCFETSQGQALPLVGACVCWHGARGTYDYDAWFEGMRQAGENYARLWMCPWAFGLETERDSRTNYRLDRAWQLDYVLKLAEQKGIYLMLCLDYHGMFEVEPDYWGGNNYWPNNPYNAVQGGPCANQDAFFTDTTARRVYQKRLRYLVGRYGYSQNLLAWQFFNEVDNVYRYLNATHVADWHAAVGDWLRAADPYGHLITTSLTGGSDRPEIWRLPQMDFANYHSYNQARPLTALAAISQSFRARYQKPVLIDEYGLDWRGWARDRDPYLRGLRQGVWAGALGGSAGTSMSWYWEQLHSENVYPLYRALVDFTARTAWGQGRWEPLTFQTAGSPPVNVGEPLPGGQPFDATLWLDGSWGAKVRGQVAVTTVASAQWAGAALNSFVHGSAHRDLQNPFKFEAWFGADARLVLHLNSVSTGPVLSVLRDGVEVLRTNLANLDGKWEVNNEYNLDLPVSMTAGKHLVEIRNRGVDWFYLDWVRLERVLPAAYAGGWQATPVAAGLNGETEMLIYVVNPEADYPASATNRTIAPLRDAALRIQGVPTGRYWALWYDPMTARQVAETTGASDGAELVLPLPVFAEDVAGHVRRADPFSLRAPARLPGGEFRAELAGAAGLPCQIEVSQDLALWQPLLRLARETEPAAFLDPSAKSLSHQFYRARLVE